MKHRAELGQWAEQQALNFLLQHGYNKIVQNFHSRYGEIDIIAKKYDQLLFIEVKARAVNAIAPAHAVVSILKQRKISQTALYFLQLHPEYAECYCRFDVLSFDFKRKFSQSEKIDFQDLNYELQWIENAFTFQEGLINL